MLDNNDLGKIGQIVSDAITKNNENVKKIFMDTFSEIWTYSFEPAFGEIYNRLDKLEAGQANLERNQEDMKVRLNTIEHGQENLKVGLNTLEQGQEDIKLRLDHHAYALDMKRTVRRVEKIERKLGIEPAD